MQLETRGHPLHSRALSLTLRRGAEGRREFAASLLDLRKRGFVPVGGDLQGSGIVHQMQLAGVVEERELRLEQIEVAQPAVAFEPSAVTGGESCRDPAPAVRGLVGERFDAGFARRLGARIGGTLGCTHVLSLAQLVGSSLPWVAAREAELFDAPPVFRRDERIFRRDLIFDGSVRGEDRVQLAAQLTDLHLRPAPPVARPIDRLAGELELRLLAEVDTATMSLLEVSAAERRRGVEDLESASWRPLDAALEGLPGLALRPGVGGHLLRHFGDPVAERPLLEVMLHLTPALFQCLAALDERWPFEAKLSPTVLGMGGPPDSCYMWRVGGALDRVRRRQEDAG